MSPREKARELSQALRGERPDYAYLKSVFHYLRQELGVAVQRTPRRFPIVPTDDEIRRYYHTVWEVRNFQDMLIIKTFLYTGVQVGELIKIRLVDVDVERCQIRVNAGKGGKDRLVPFAPSFKEVLAMHAEGMKRKGAPYLFESSWKRPYSDRGIRKLLARYTKAPGLLRPISPHRLRHYLLTWLKKQGIDDALIQPYSGHASRQSLEIYSRLALADAQQAYNRVIDRFPV
jgi:integrase/recombinase XerD